MAAAPVIRLHPEDGVLIARSSAAARHRGAPMASPRPSASRPATRSRSGRSRRASRSAATARSSASPPQPIAPGQQVHTHNCAMGDFARTMPGAWMRSRPPIAERPRRFQGIRRADGRVATRNYIGIITTVNCSAHVADLIADAFRRNPITGDDPLADWPNVDGVVALTHKTGCGMTQGEPLTPAAPHARRLRAACQFLPRHRHRPRLRGEPDRRAAGGAAAGRAAAQHGHPGDGRHAEDGGGRHRLRARGAGRGQQGPARAGAGQRADAWRCNAAARTAIPASPPTRRWARPPTWWCGTAAR